MSKEWNMIGVNHMRRSVNFFVHQMGFMTEEDAKEFVEAVKNPVPPDSWVNDIKGEKRTNAPWHSTKNGPMAQVAFNHVFLGEPLPCPDGKAIALSEKQKKLAQIKAMLAEKKVDDELAKAEAELNEYRKKRKATKKKTEEKDESTDGGTKEVS